MHDKYGGDDCFAYHDVGCLLGYRILVREVDCFMTYEDKLIIGITVPITILLIAGIVLGIYLYERKYHPKEKSKNETIKEPETEFLQAKALRKRVHIYYTNYLNLSRSVTEYYITFLLENGEEKEYALSQEMFEKIEEGQESTLVLLNGMFFDFGEGESVDNVGE